MNDQKGSKKRKGNIKCFLPYLGPDRIYKCFVYFIFNILSHHTHSVNWGYQPPSKIPHPSFYQAPY